MKLSHTVFITFRTLIVGFIAGLLLLILWELRENTPLLLLATGLMVTAWYLNIKIANHFHGHHHRAGDSGLDAITPAVLILANILHPAVDGFSFYQILTHSGIVAGALVGSGIIVHEVLRQFALITAFRHVGIQWHTIVITALFGIGGGIVLGIFQSGIVEKYEAIADMATIFAYAFVISEYHLHESEAPKKGVRIAGFLAGVIVAGTLHFFLSGQ